jgi:GNAT superfamily N-acetyltransferase
MATVIIRTAEPTDWERIWPFFTEIVAAGDTYTIPQEIGHDEARELWMQRPPGGNLVAVDDDGSILGTAKICPNQTGRGSHIANAGFMVNPACAGRGVGRALAMEALQWARTSGYTAMQFNAVVETNTGAVHLWKSLGFTIIATVPEAFDHPEFGPVGLHIMYRRL